MAGKVEKWIRDRVLGPAEERGSDPHAESRELNGEDKPKDGGDRRG